MNTTPQAGVHRRRRPGPPDYGSGSLWPDSPFRRAKLEWILRRFPAHWGLVPSKFVSVCSLTHTAWCLPTCSVRRWSCGRPKAAPTKRLRVPRVGADVSSARDNCPAALVLPRKAGSFQRTCPPNFAHSGPSGPGARRSSHSDFARRMKLPSS